MFSFGVGIVIAIGSLWETLRVIDSFFRGVTTTEFSIKVCPEAISRRMSRSYRTQKESVIAARRTQCDPDGNPVLPRIVARRPAPGDIHPLSKRTIARLLPTLPAEYVYGLSRVELRARQGTEIGEPFGWYGRDEHAIILYSLPTTWKLPGGVSRQFAHTLRRFHAELTFDDNAVTVSWINEEVMGLWFYCEVFTHELGHHFSCQYESRNGRIRGKRFREIVADLQARRFTEELFSRYRSRKAALEPAAKPY